MKRNFHPSIFVTLSIPLIDTCFVVRLVHICLRIRRIRRYISPITWSTYRNIARSTYVNWVVAWTNNDVAAVVARHSPLMRVKVTTGILRAFEIPLATHSPREVRHSLPFSSPLRRDTGRNCKICNSNSLVLAAHRTLY